MGCFRRMISTAKGLVALMCGAAAAGLLTACKPGADQASAQDAPPPLAALPLTNVSAPQSKPGPLAVDLPYARPARIGPMLDPGDGYAYLDRAYFLNDAFGEAPPDYALDYDDETPWAWRTDDGFVRVVEGLPYGDRYYYYQPGDEDPFLIRDPDYAYAYADGGLVAIYDDGGALLPPEDLMLHAPIAGRELARARAMTRDAVERQPIAVASWTSRRGQVASELGQWQKLVGHQTGWRRYHQAHLKQEQAHWAPERFRREAETARVLQRVHDPDGAQHAWREARRAQDVARKAHVKIALLPRAGTTRAGPPGARLAMAAPGPVRELRPVRPGGGSDFMAMTARFGPGREPRVERVRPAGSAAPERGRPERLAMAPRDPEPRAQYNVRAHGRAFEPPAEPHLRAAEQARALRQDRPSAILGDVHSHGGGERAQRPAEPPHLQIVLAARSPAQHAGDEGGRVQPDHPHGRGR